jgi:hypothetical protein
MMRAYWILLLLVLGTLPTIGRAQAPSPQTTTAAISTARGHAKKAASAETFLNEHKDADPTVLTQVYKLMFLSYALDSNWTKVLETYNRMSLAPKLTDDDKEQFAQIAEKARALQR